MNDIELSQLETKINNINFKGCENVKVGDVLHYNLNVPVDKLGIIRGLLRILRNEISDSYVYKIYGTPKTVMLFSNEYIVRKDHLRSFEKVCETLDDYIKIVAVKRHITKPAGSLPLVLVWMKQLRKLRKSLPWRLYIVSRLQQCYCDYRFISRFLKKSKIELLNMVTYCDVMAVDHFIVQMCNSLNVRTITLQHGVFRKGSFPYTHSKSDFFLAHNLFSKDNALKSGMSEDKIYIVGIPGLIGFNSENNVQRKHNGIIGIVLSGAKAFQAYDIELVKMVKRFREKYECKIYIKFHPGYGANSYSENVWNDIEEMYEEEITAYDFAEKVDFTVDDGSTLFMEYTLRQEVAFTFLCSQSFYNGCENLEMCFSSYDEMEKLFLLYYNNSEKLKEMMKRTREYFSTDVAPYELYKDFFENKLQR